MFKKILNYLIIFFLFFCFSFVLYHYKILPNQIILKVNEVKYIYKNWKNKIKVVKYRAGLSPWSDRDYFNRKNDEKLKDFYLIQIPRHYEKNIYLKITDEVIIYRILCKKNDGSGYSDWEKENFELEIIGKSCVHSKIVKKKFQNATVKLIPARPNEASNPIFVHDLKSTKKFSIIYNK